MASWRELPRARSAQAAPDLRDLRSRLEPFFERQLAGRDPRLAQEICWIYPSTGMAEYGALLYLPPSTQSGGFSYYFGADHAKTVAASCSPAGARTLGFLAKVAQADGTSATYVALLFTSTASID